MANILQEILRIDQKITVLKLNENLRTVVHIDNGRFYCFTKLTRRSEYERHNMNVGKASYSIETVIKYFKLFLNV